MLLSYADKFYWLCSIMDEQTRFFFREALVMGWHGKAQQTAEKAFSFYQISTETFARIIVCFHPDVLF